MHSLWFALVTKQSQLWRPQVSSIFLKDWLNMSSCIPVHQVLVTQRIGGVKIPFTLTLCLLCGLHTPYQQFKHPAASDAWFKSQLILSRLSTVSLTRPAGGLRSLQNAEKLLGKENPFVPSLKREHLWEKMSFMLNYCPPTLQGSAKTHYL